MKTNANTSYRFGTGISDIEFAGTWTGWLKVDTRETNIGAAKREIRHFLLNGPDSKKYRAPEFLMYLKIVLDGAEIELSALSREVQEQILDELIFENKSRGEFIEHAEVVVEEDFE